MRETQLSRSANAMKLLSFLPFLLFVLLVVIRSS